MSELEGRVVLIKEIDRFRIKYPCKIKGAEVEEVWPNEENIIYVSKPTDLLKFLSPEEVFFSSHVHVCIRWGHALTHGCSFDLKNEYSKYGICIKVQFRESGRLQQLGPHLQSGGERAVSTAIYMLSLQELTTVPFRCVDEINQGMDEFNERVVFKLMVSTVEKANSAQCFLLTPKVLQTLDYSENVKVLCIYSGGSTVSHVEFNVKRYLDKVHSQSVKCKRESLKRKHSDSDSSD